jgi:hypothetical protein
MTERYYKIIGLPGGGRWCVEKGTGMGGGGLPDAHPMRNYCIVEFRGSRSIEYETALSLDAAADAGRYPWVPEPVRAKARELLA